MFTRSLSPGFVIFALAAGASAADEQEAPSAEQIEFFEKKIRPVLVQQCYKCHSEGEKVKGGLLLDSRATAAPGRRERPGAGARKT